MKKLFSLLGVILLSVSLISCTVINKDDGEEFVTVEITMDNYMDYIGFETTDTAIDIDGNPIDHTCVVITSKLYDDGLYFISSDDSKWSLQFTGNTGLGILGGAPFGTVLEEVSSPVQVKVTDIQGKYKFVKSDYVEEYVFEDGVRKLILKDGRYQEVVFEGISAVDFSHPY